MLHLNLLLLLALNPGAHATALDEYVKKADPHYSWQIKNVIQKPESTTFIIEMISQNWRSKREVDKPQWRHWMTVVQPKSVTTSKALLYIGGGSSQDGPPLEAPFEALACRTHSVVAEVRSIPNQPLVYFNDGKPRSEDDSVAYSWAKVLTTSDPTWSIRLPMVKSAVRALDTVTALMKSKKVKVDQFVVAGASKRGWTTWLTAAADPRVIGIIPMVIDILNVRKNMEHHHARYGFWAPAVHDYVEHRIDQHLASPALARLLKFEDPYSYLDRLQMPKLILNASGDQFFPPDSSQFYFHALQGPKYLRYLPNADHSMQGTDVLGSLEAFYTSLLETDGTPVLPRFSWSKNQDGALVVHALDKPDEVLMWAATNLKGCDFRADTFGKHFSSTRLKAQGDGTYAGLPQVEPGCTAFFIELTYQRSGPPHKFTTEVQIVKKDPGS